ncbi:GNAT family N-acetyltransferase [Sphingomonas sp. RIT328]|uniref:GNAT family N-acetyltransferase n=1 Tax=Sphingomonas sp. RIT328 TaxID=1470591 RepID=UPI000452E988|nr:GNAT family N-acetyltransferase [Sphingomonas sp. RIT328]EZP49979.1 N-acetyltransferase GCN5 [Sphingomonas sp. RIT328]
MTRDRLGASVREAGSTDLPFVRAMLLDYAASLPFDLAYQGFAREVAGLPHPYVRPEGLLLVASVDGEPCGVGAYRRLAPELAEVKRMVVAPERRGRGVGRLLLATLMHEAAVAGYVRICLDTHRPSMGDAIGLYRSLGFDEISPYADDRGGQIAFFEAPLP